MTKFLSRMVAGALVGLGLGVVFILPYMTLGGFLPKDNLLSAVFVFVHWPIHLIERWNYHHGGRLYEDFRSMILIVTVYWMLVGEICYGTVVTIRARRRKHSGSHEGGFPVGPS